MFNELALIIIGVLALSFGAIASPVPFADADVERSAAIEAEKNGNIEEALLHYETILDSTKTAALARLPLRSKIAELKQKVAPNTDPSKAGVWKVKAVIIRTLDYKWTDEDGKEHHALNTFTDEEVEMIRKGMEGYQKLVWDYTDGNLRIEWDLVVAERSLKELSYDKDWGHCPYNFLVMPVISDLVEYGTADTVMVYIKMWVAEGEKGESVPVNYLADCTGVDFCTNGATYVGYCSGNGGCMSPSGEVQLHEWLHAAEMSISWVHGYPHEEGLGPVDWTSDVPQHEEPSGCFKRQPGQEGGLPVYHHMMRDHVTRKMWRESPLFNRSDNPWLSTDIRDWLVIGPFSGKDKPFGGLNEAFIDEPGAAPKLGAKIAGKEWKLALAPGRFPNLANIVGAVEKNQVCYAAFTVESDSEQLAILTNIRNGGCKIWQNGKLILDSPWNRENASVPNTLDISLQKGKNLFLVKLNDVLCDWAFNLKISDMGGGMLPGVKFVLP